MTKRYESARGQSFTREEIEDLPGFNSEEEDFEAWLEYENEHGITPDEAQQFANEIEEEHNKAKIAEEYADEYEEEPLKTETMVDGYGREYEQYVLDLTDDDLDELQDDSKGKGMDK